MSTSVEILLQMSHNMRCVRWLRRSVFKFAMTLPHSGTVFVILPDRLQVKGLAEIYRVLKTGGRLVIADMIRPKSSAGLGALIMILVHNGWPFDGDDLRGLLKGAGFQEITQPEERFSAVGFMRAVK